MAKIRNVFNDFLTFAHAANHAQLTLRHHVRCTVLVERFCVDVVICARRLCNCFLQKDAGEAIVDACTDVLGVFVQAAVHPYKVIKQKDADVFCQAFAFGDERLSSVERIRPAIERLRKSWCDDFEHKDTCVLTQRADYNLNFMEQF